MDEFLQDDADSWMYYCCGPTGEYPNRFLDYPAYRVRVLGLHLYRFARKGFLHWGANFWTKRGTLELLNPFHVTDAGSWPSWPAGDGFMMYPGADGPIESIRWEQYRAGFDDYRLLTLAASKVGKDKVQSLLKDIKTPKDFPQTPDYIRQVRKQAAALVMKG